MGQFSLIGWVSFGVPLPSKRIPEDAFEYYVSLGAERSYQALADEYGVSKRAITKVAGKQSWSERLERIERQAREASDRRLAETLEDMRTRHLKTIRAMYARVLAALREFPLTSGMEAMRAAEMAIKLERLVAGEPTERTASIEEVVKRESERWLVHPDPDEAGATLDINNADEETEEADQQDASVW